MEAPFRADCPARLIAFNHVTIGAERIPEVAAASCRQSFPEQAEANLSLAFLRAWGGNQDAFPGIDQGGGAGTILGSAQSRNFLPKRFLASRTEK